MLPVASSFGTWEPSIPFSEHAVKIEALCEIVGTFRPRSNRETAPNIRAPKKTKPKKAQLTLFVNGVMSAVDLPPCVIVLRWTSNCVSIV